MRIYIYGAKSVAIGVCRALQILYPSHKVEGFLVTSLEGNPTELLELPVLAIEEFASRFSQEEKLGMHILIATPENIHKAIVATLEEYGFLKYTCVNSEIEAKLMERFYEAEGVFSSLHQLPFIVLSSKKSDFMENVTNMERPQKGAPSLYVLTAKFYKDIALQNEYTMPEWTCPIQVGAALTDVRVADCLDNAGDNISLKNVNYCELTALYWLWKNELLAEGIEQADYYGLFHYRRVLEVSDEDILRLREHDIDVILPYPMLHEPDAFEHHTRYVKEEDWNAMLTALEELQPEYAKAMPEIFAKPYVYNYNMLIAKSQVLADYCAWLFPILERTEALTCPKGWERADRYIGYMGENLLTLYFMYNKDKYKIVHTGRRMLV